MSQEERALLERKGKDASICRIACMCRVYGDAQANLPDTDAFILTDYKGGLPAYDGGDPSLGFAVDIGTTTLALLLIDMAWGAPLAKKAALNPQAAYGADVLSRIVYSNANGPEDLARAVREKLWELMEEALSEVKCQKHMVSRLSITGNTTMLHYLAGLDPRGIGVAPFTPQSLFGCSTNASSIFPELENAELYLPDCISSYVGADITCGIAALEAASPAGSTLLVDAGTNGEMALMTDGKILCCATAAGPAFEGAQISMGMIASSGAVYNASLVDGKIAVKAIGDARPIGVCGTGLISSACLALETGALEDSGYLEDAPFMLGDSGVSLNGNDFRQLQLAKSAIAAGIDTLVQEAGSPSDLTLVFAGGFGNFLNPMEASKIGLIPSRLAEKSRCAGNTALHGAAMALVSHEFREKIKRMAKEAKEVQLSSNPVFTDLYMEHMMFESFQ
jgi:uncharacterized 2Fe-2S/4Fe-4S cluster protein (DUF4445 family)